MRKLFQVAYWFGRTYARNDQPSPSLLFDASRLPKDPSTSKPTADQLNRLSESLRERDEKLSTLLADKSALDDERKRLRAEVAVITNSARAEPDTHDYSEAETRGAFIDLMLNEAGWPLDRSREDGAGRPRTVRAFTGGHRARGCKGCSGAFLNGSTWSASQIEFVNLIVNHLTEHGIIQPANLYESPFTDIAPRGPESLFDSSQVDELLRTLESVRVRAVAA